MSISAMESVKVSWTVSGLAMRWGALLAGRGSPADLGQLFLYRRSWRPEFAKGSCDFIEEGGQLLLKQFRAIVANHRRPGQS